MRWIDPLSGPIRLSEAIRSGAGPDNRQLVASEWESSK
jgi:hypothetical protein